MSKLKVILLDDEMLIRKLIRMKMNAEELGLEIVGEFSNARSALQEIEELQPDIILSDICMPEMDGLSFGEECTRILPGVKIIVITGSSGANDERSTDTSYNLSGSRPVSL